MTILSDEMDFKARDRNGVVPDLAIIGRRYMHQNGKRYMVGGWSFDADRQRWMIGYKALPAGVVVFMRLPEEFFGQRNGKPRFVRIHDGTH